MKAPRELWRARTKQERILILVLAALLGTMLCWWLFQSATQARARLNAAMPLLQAQAARLEQQAAEYGRLRKLPARSPVAADPRAQVLAQIAAAGLSHALTRIDVANPNEIRLAFGAVPFAGWLALASALQAQHLHIESCRVEASARAGWVSVTATLVRDATP